MSAAHGRTLIVGALLLGVGGDILLRGADLRLGATLWIVLVVTGAIVAHGMRSDRGNEASGGRERVILLAALLLAASGFVLRDDPMLFSIDLMSVLVLGALLAWSGRGERLASFQIDDGVRATLTALWGAFAGAVRVLRLGLSDPAEEGEVSSRRARRRDFVVGAVIAVPPILIVASFLGAADPVLGEWLASWSAIVSEETLEHLLVIGVIGWAAAGWLGSIARGDAAERAGPGPIRADTVFARIAPSLYGLSGLLAIYLGLQARVLFGGAAYLAATGGLTVAEYARAGFFDLAAVSAVVLGVLLVADRVLDQARAADARHFRTAGTLLLLLVSILIVSALARMGLYVRYFGLSTERLYALAAMLGIGVALGWFGWTVLRGQRSRFGPGLLVATGLWVVLLNVSNPEAIVVRVNVERAVGGKPFDVPYHRALSADALPALGAALQVLPSAPCMALRDALAQDSRARRHEPSDWQSWSVPTSARRLRAQEGARCGPTVDVGPGNPTGK